MKDQKLQKTNVYRLLDQAGAVYTQHYYGDTEAVSGTEVAEALHEDPDRVFKTLVTAGRSGEHYVFMIPVAEELDLRKAASAAGEKSVGMIKAKELLPLTGYIHGGSRRLQPDRHEKAVRDICRRDGGIVRHRVFQRGEDRIPGRDERLGP